MQRVIFSYRQTVDPGQTAPRAHSCYRDVLKGQADDI